MKLDELEIGREYRLSPFVPEIAKEYEVHPRANDEMIQFASLYPTVKLSGKTNLTGTITLEGSKWIWLPCSLEPLKSEVKLTIS